MANPRFIRIEKTDDNRYYWQFLNEDMQPYVQPPATFDTKQRCIEVAREMVPNSADIELIDDTD